MLYTVIMAGGSGTRFWPLSRQAMPKQAIPICGPKSLFQRAVERVDGLTPPERTFVITNAEQADILASQAPRIPRENIIAEPFARDSAAAVFLGAAIAAARDEDAVTLVKPADHIISPVDKFHAAVKRAVTVAEKGCLVTFGVPPRFPATGYGYIERGEPLEGIEGAYKVRRFREKPDQETAEGYVADGRHYWNSGMFVWRARDILEAARRFAPAHYEAIAPLGEAFGGEGFQAALADAYGALEKISIDFAVMEKAENIATVEADFEWDDVGTPVSLRDYFEADAEKNVVRGRACIHDASRCVLISDDDHLLAVVGCHDLVVIHTADATLVCPAGRIGDVKKLVNDMAGDEQMRKYL